MKTKLTYGQMVVVAYVGVSLIGTALLMLPWASAEPGTTTLLQAWFTAVSAFTVTGLTVVNTGAHWSTFGQVVILLLIQTGGLGLMVLSSFLMLLLGFRLNLGHRVLAAREHNLNFGGGLVALLRNIAILVLVIEILGSILLYFAMFEASQANGNSVFFAVFHAVSAFNGAGLDISGDSFLQYRASIGVNLVVMALILLGSLGYVVLLELLGLFRRWHRLSLHSRLVLIMTITITLVSGLVYWFLEHTGSLVGQPWSQQIIESLFQSATRTCGFVSVPVTEWNEPFLFLTIITMFIGASPGSVGGGIKTTTFAVIILAAWAIARGKKDVVIFEREIDPASVSKAFTITVLALVMVCAGTLLLMLVDALPFMTALFEVVSALATAGLSMGVTEQLSPCGMLLISIFMLIGRIGIITVVVLLSKQEAEHIHYMKEPIYIG